MQRPFCFARITKFLLEWLFRSQQVVGHVMYKKFIYLFALFGTLFAAEKEEGHQMVEKISPTCYIFGDVLYMKGYADGMQLATRRGMKPGNNVDKKVVTFDSEWEWGGRIGVGRKLKGHDNWELFATYAYYHGHAEESTRAGEAGSKGAQYCATCPRQPWSTFLGSQVFSAKGSWHSDVHVIDVNIGRYFQASQNISIRPYFGGRGTLLDLSIVARYDGAWRDGQDQVVERGTNFNGHSGLHGGGIRTGSSFAWMFNRNWSIFTDFSASLLWGHFKVKETFKGGETTSGSLEPYTETFHKNFSSIRTNLEASVGLKYECFLSGGERMISIFFGYELSKWFRANELFTVNRIIQNESGTPSAVYLEDPISNDLGFQAFVLRAKVGF